MLLRRKKTRPYGHGFRRAHYDAVDAFERVGDFGRRADYSGVGADLMQIKAAHSLK